jgi:fermentation-respiration switch protein FrsA (DUF1100 family)
LLLTLLVAAGFVLAVLWAGQRRMMYFPSARVPPPASVGLTDTDAVTFTTEDGLALNGWFVRPSAQPAGSTLIVFNGNAGNRALRAPLAAALARRGLATLLFDYRGYGGNPGSPSEAGLMRDARAAYAYLARQPDIDPSRIAYYGESLGTAVATQLAVEHPPAALILRSPFTSMADVGQYHYPLLPVRWLIRDRFASIEVIDRVTSPVLVIAGTRDRIVPAQFSERLYQTAREPKGFLSIDADHNDEELLDGEQLIEAMVEFVARSKR